MELPSMSQPLQTSSLCSHKLGSWLELRELSGIIHNQSRVIQSSLTTSPELNKKQKIKEYI